MQGSQSGWHLDGERYFQGCCFGLQRCMPLSGLVGIGAGELQHQLGHAMVGGGL
jgi:hypothetical protein